MLKISGYTILESIYNSDNSIVYRARRDADGESVILKRLSEDYPDPDKLKRYKREYEITRTLQNLEGVVRAYSLEKSQNFLVMVLEDFGGKSLAKLLELRRFELAEFLDIAIKSAESLGQIHQADILHKDINPANIIYHPETGQLKLIDFGISTVLSRENTTLRNPQKLEGTLAYMSPEQTGRMNRCVNYRTDFYSLGATFYQLLTHSLPFEVSDVMELVHCHLAKYPISPCEVDETIPKALSDIVMKLMAKTAEERYQSAYGIQADLEICRSQLRETGRIDEFPLGTQELYDRFQIPEKLYGREAEIETLLAAFQRAIGEGTDAAHSEMMLIAGYSGIGKSALVQEIYKPITAYRGYFIGGKFDQLQRNIPYTGIVQAFSAAIAQILTESESQIQQWRDRLLAALGVNAQIIIDAIPDVELIIGPQPPVEELGATEAQNRFNLVFLNFVKVFAQKEHPLVLFLDDLQWVDSASLKLIQLLMSESELNYLFFIGAYRDNEVSATHPLSLALENIRQSGAIVHQISLPPLSGETVNQSIADTLRCTTEETAELAGLVFQKTQGNPFFMKEFLTSLYADELLYFEYPSGAYSEGDKGNIGRTGGGWQWELGSIQTAQITDNVVELMAGKIQKLGEETQDILKIAACIGNQFDLQTLAVVTEEQPETIARRIFSAVKGGLIVALGEDYKFVEFTDRDRLAVRYQFVHDRVQQAAYELIAEDVKRAVHHKIGGLLLKNTPANELGTNLFEIVGHLNCAADLIDTESESIELARLNLSAAQKAKDATAYAASLEYLHAGIACLPAQAWVQHYELTFALHKELAEVEYLNGNIERSRELINLLLAEAKTTLEKAEIYHLLVLQYTVTANYPAAIETGKTALKLLGIELPETDLKAAFEAELARIQTRLSDRDVSALLDAPHMQNPEHIIALKLLVNLITSTFASDYDLFTVVSTKVVNFSLDYGHCRDSSMVYSNYSNIVGSALGNYKLAYELCQLALQLSDKFNNLTLKCKDGLIFGYVTNHWFKPLKQSEAIFDEAYQAGLAVGELQYAGFLLHCRSVHHFCQGNNLLNLLANIEEFLPFTYRTNNQWSIDELLAIKLVSLKLIGQNQEQSELEQTALTEEQFLFDCESHHSFQPLCVYHTFNALALYLDGELSLAKESIAIGHQYQKFITGGILVADINFYQSLIFARLYATASETETQEYPETIASNQQQMKIWADNCPENFLHKYLLVEAEIARIEGRDLEAMELYDRAIASAGENEFIHYEALANELAAKFWRQRGKEDFATIYLKKAYYGYQLWGAQRKLEELERNYPQVVSQKQSSRQLSKKSITQTSGAHQDSDLDFATVMKASQAISSEVVLSALLSKLMAIAIENAGAQKGSLILSQNGQLTIEAAREVDGEIQVLNSVPIQQADILPQSIINYVARTGESVVLSDASAEGNFTADPYIIAHQSQSVLCAPILNQGKLIGMIYLENNLVADAFTPQRLEVLSILSAQAAISIENALLYQTLEQKVIERTAQLAAANENLELANQEITVLNERLKAENLRMSAELDVTRRLQQMILPKPAELEAIAGLDIAAFMESADEVGGDYYDILQHEGRVKIGIGDVTGHGLESGVLMMMAQTAIRSLFTHRETDAVKFLQTLNQTLYENVLRMNSDKTLTLSLIDYEQNCLRLSGQHEEVILVRSSGEVERIDTMDLGFPVGLESDIADFIAETEVKLNPGDVVVLYTDGITEALDASGDRLYGLERFIQVVRDHRQESAAQIKAAAIADLQQHMGDRKPDDDITLIVLKQR
ncbi:SpoIIE family protein phosphatase [Phormidium sp. CCY1219]|uniref:SpoIIE family protein phosphatase n=1 Tax=Phormidium sp. CCY1219 TaxID=2886104 RepID=UPI002D1F91C7|nr:AAA family ATPase [Phormidium sp. CCY1219]MEB3827970.1 AAA family ATPase [Phormidium sp. CCY1219]